jgi:hypothetical protein
MCFPTAENAPDQAPFKTLGLLRRRRLEGFPMRSEPRLDNAVAAHAAR